MKKSFPSFMCLAVVVSQCAEPLVVALLKLPSLSSLYLSKAAFEVLESILSERSATATLRARELTDALLAMQPPSTATAVLPGWLGALEHAFITLSIVDPSSCRDLFCSTFGCVLEHCSSQVVEPAVRFRSEKAAVGMIRWCLPVDQAQVAGALRLASLTTTEFDTTVQDSLPLLPLAGVCLLLKEAMATLAYRGIGLSHIVPIISALIHRLKICDKSSNTRAACALLKEHIQLLGRLRAQPKFEFQQQVNAALGASVEVCGPEWVLSLLPLDLFQQGDDRLSETARTWLLPILRSNTSNTNLNHFKRAIQPMCRRLAEQAALARNDRKALEEAKIYDTLLEQLWALLPGYCDLPRDLDSSFDASFAEELCQTLYAEKNLRPMVFRALQVLVEKNENLATSTAPTANLLADFGVDQSKAQANLSQLSRYAPDILSVMFNVLAAADSDERGYMLSCVRAYLRLLSPSVRFARDLI